jgi:hypothetical protein
MLAIQEISNARIRLHLAVHLPIELTLIFRNLKTKIARIFFIPPKIMYPVIIKKFFGKKNRVNAMQF